MYRNTISGIPNRRVSRGWVRGVRTHPCSSSWSLLYICNYALNNMWLSSLFTAKNMYCLKLCILWCH